MHSSLLTTHGQFLQQKTGPLPQGTLVPRFSLCATLLHHDIRPPMPYDWDFESDSDPGEDEDEADEGGAFEEDLPWDLKVYDRLGWRGHTTGMHAYFNTAWQNAHRSRLVSLANALEGNVSVLRVPANETGIESWVEGLAHAGPVGEPENMTLAQVNPAWMDVAYTDGPIQCYGTCVEMTDLWSFQKAQGHDEEGRYKFIFDVRVHVFVYVCVLDWGVSLGGWEWMVGSV